jgi:Putative Tad-like Flp pilus-assembly
MAMIYVIISMVAMLSFCSLAVDWGRVQTGKTEIRRAADAASRVAAAFLPQGTSLVRSNAEAVALLNKVDGTGLVIPDSGVTIGTWNSSTHAFSTNAVVDNVTIFNAVQVTAQRQIPLMFGTVVGRSSCTVTATSVAALMAVQAPVTDYVSAHGDPWLAGEPKNTLGSEPDNEYVKNLGGDAAHPWEYDIANPAAVKTAVTNDISSGTYTPPTKSTKLELTDFTTGQPYASPTGFALTVTPGSVIQISVPLDSTDTSVNSGFYDKGTTPTYYANGSNSGTYSSYSDDAANPGLPQGTNTTSGSENGLSNIIAPLNSMIGVFMDSTGSTTGAAADETANGTSVPPGLNFSTQTARDYTSYEPQLNQTFYVGNGTTSSGSTQQTIIIPPNATTLFLGTMDGHEWSNNQGGFNATITQYQVQVVH